MLYRSQTVPLLRFTGRARVVDNAADKDKAYNLAHEKERAQDAEKKGTAVIIDLDEVFGVTGFGKDGPIFVSMAR